MFKDEIKLIPSLMDGKFIEIKSEINDAIARKIAKKIKDKKVAFLEKVRKTKSGG